MDALFSNAMLIDLTLPKSGVRTKNGCFGMQRDASRYPGFEF